MTLDQARMLLGVSRDCLYEELKKAFRQRAKLTHPDLSKNKDGKDFLLVKRAFDMIEPGAIQRSKQKKASPPNKNEPPPKNVIYRVIPTSALYRNNLDNPWSFGVQVYEEFAKEGGVIFFVGTDDTSGSWFSGIFKVTPPPVLPEFKISFPPGAIFPNRVFSGMVLNGEQKINIEITFLVVRRL
jgi:hypothetical protein